MARFPAAQKLVEVPVEAEAASLEEAEVLASVAPSTCALGAAVDFQRPAEAVAAELLVSLHSAVVAACLLLSERPTRVVARTLVMLLLPAAVACFQPSFGLT
jgi:hypothetical protein